MSGSPYLNQQHALSQQGFPAGVPGWYGSRIDLSSRRPVAPQDQYWRRFLEIYHNVCGTPRAPLPSLFLRTEQSWFPSDDEVNLADELFLQELGKVTRSKSIWRSQKKSDAKDYTTATAALLRLVQVGGGRPGVAQCLVRKGGTISLSKDPQKQAKQISERHELIIIATTLRQTQLVHYFATISPPERIATALAISVKNDNIELTKVLLENGASPDSLFHTIPDHFNLLSSAMLELLLQSPTTVSQRTRDRWLQSAVSDAKMNLAIMLLRYGASPSFNYLSILHKAIEALHLEVFIIALKCMQSSGAMHFDGLLQQLARSPGLSFADKMLATEATLCIANSKEARTFRQRLRVSFLLEQDASETLDICASSGQIGLIELLRQPRFNTEVSARTLLSAIKACDLHLFDHLYPENLPDVPPKDLLLEVLPAIEDHQTRERLLLRLLKIQVQGTYLEKELVHAVRNQDETLVRLILNAGASADYNGGEALALAVEAQHVPLMKQLLPHSRKSTRNTVFPRLQAGERLSRRLMTKLFVERGLSRDVLNAALQYSVCECQALRDEAIIDILVKSGADYRLIEPSSVHGLIDQSDVASIADLLRRMTESMVSSRSVPALVSQLMGYLMQCPKENQDDHVRFEMIKLFLKYGATGDFILSAFEAFLSSKSVADEDLLSMFLSPAPCNRTVSYSNFVAQVLNSMDLCVLSRLIHTIELYDEVLQLVLEGAASKALNDDAGTAARLQYFLAHMRQNNPILEWSLDTHIRKYAIQCPSINEWPLKTIGVLISKGFAGTAWLTHALMAITEAGNAEVLSLVLKSAQQIFTKDTIDSVLMLAVQQNSGLNLQIPEILLNFGASQSGLNVALLIASETDYAEVCAMLLQYGADVNYQSGECLVSALKQNRQATLERLLAPGNANESSLAGAWTFLTSNSCDLATAYKVESCRILLHARFSGPQVREFLMHCVASPSPDYEMIRTILDESETMKQDQSEVISTFEGSLVLLGILACAIGTANGRLCRLILSYFPTSFHVPHALLKTATITSTAILDLIIKHVPIAERQDVLDICLVHAVSLATDCGTCTYLLYEGASCEALDYSAISAATSRALLCQKSDRAPLEVLLSSGPSQMALRSACHIAVDFLKNEEKTASRDFCRLRTIKVLHLVFSAGLRDLETLKFCMHSLCNQSRSQAFKCKECVRETNARESLSNIDCCCPFRRTQTRTKLLMHLLLDLGLIVDHNNGQSIVAATRNFQHEMLEVLLSSARHVATSIPEWFVDQSDCEIFFQNASRCIEQREARLETMRALLKHGANFPALECALVTAVHESVANAEARITAELLIKFNIRDVTGAALRFLAEHPQPAIRPLLSLALEGEPSRDLRLSTIETLIASDLDEESVSSLVFSALCGSSSQLLEMTVEETQRVLRATAEAGKAETLTLILSCIPDKSILSPFYDSSCFIVWLLRSRADLTECFLTAVLEWFGPEEIQKIDNSGEGLCLVQEAVLNQKFRLIPILVSSGAATVTKAGKSLLYDTLEKIKVESPDVLKAIRSLCNELTLNDGSLHLTVVNMLEAVVNLLLDQGHDANFGIPFDDSADKSLALNMLCAKASVVAHESDCGLTFKRIAINLMMHGARIGAKMCGRSLLYNALDNPRCTVGLLRNVMDCLQFSEQLDESVAQSNLVLSVPDSPGALTSSLSGAINDTDDTQSFKTAPSAPSISEKLVRSTFFEFEDGIHHYSASMYLIREVPCPPFFKQPRFPPQKKAALLEFLRMQDLPDIFYALEGPQPDSAVGVPIELLLGSTECAVCEDTVTHIDNAFGNLTQGCTHNWTVFMCKECLDGYMTSKITVENGAVNSIIPCWAEGCSNVLSHYEIKKYADPELFELYDHALLQQIIHEGETFAECSSRGCKGGGWLESEDVSYFECQLCHQETCVSHNGPRKDHAGKPCPATPEGQRYAEEEAREEAERQAAIEAKTKAEKEAKRKAKAEADRIARERKDGLKATQALMKKISKNCPKCKVPIEKSVGCDHMTCRSGSGRAGCGAEFCWECLVPYTAIRTEGNGAHQVTCPHYRRNTYLH